jgi:hypothetical protein
LYFLTNTGFEIRPLRVSLFTTAFNRQIQKWGTLRPRLQLAWFTAGTWVSIILMPLSVFLIFHTMVITLRNYFQDGKATSSIVVVEPMVSSCFNIDAFDDNEYVLNNIIINYRFLVGTFHHLILVIISLLC